ncbi:MAG: response regulator [Cyanobacteriota bacterium]
MNKHQLISLLLVDDDHRFRQGIQTLISFYNSDQFSFEIVGEAASLEQALKVTEQQHPSLILLDLELPKDNGITGLKRLRELPYEGKILVLSGHHEDEWVFQAMQSGANGYIFKESVAKHLNEAIATVLKNEVYLAPEVATAFFRMFHFHSGRSLQACQTLHLTDREQQVLHWLVQGASNEEIARHLFVTVATVKAHLTSIFEKLSVTSRTQAIIKALKLGLVR